MMDRKKNSPSHAAAELDLKKGSLQPQLVIHGQADLNPAGNGSSGIDFTGLYNASVQKEITSVKKLNTQIDIGGARQKVVGGQGSNVPKYKKMQTMYNQSKFYSNLLPSTGMIGEFIQP